MHACMHACTHACMEPHVQPHVQPCVQLLRVYVSGLAAEISSAGSQGVRLSGSTRHHSRRRPLGRPHIILYYTILYYTILYYTILYYIVLYYTILYYTILYYITLHYTILYYTIRYYTILHPNTIRRSSSGKLPPGAAAAPRPAACGYDYY